MSDDNEEGLVDEIQEQKAKMAEDANTLTDIFSERSLQKEKDPEEPKEQEEEVKEAKKSASKSKKDQEEGEEEKRKKLDEKKELSNKNDKKETAKPKVIEEDDKDDEDEKPEHVVALEKVTKSLNDTKKWGHSLHNKIKGAMREIERAVESGELTEDQANRWRDALESDHPEPKVDISDNQNPLNSLISIASEKMDDLKEILSEDEDFDNKLEAFDFLISNVSAKRRKEIFEDLVDLKDRPTKLARKMLSIGEEFYGNFYKELSEAGGFEEWLEVRDKKISKMQKTIDKQQKRLSQYEDHDQPTNRINELGLDVRTPAPKSDNIIIHELFSESGKSMKRR